MFEVKVRKSAYELMVEKMLREEALARYFKATVSALSKQEKNTMFGAIADCECVGCRFAPVCPECELPAELRFKDWEKTHDGEIPFDLTCPGPRYEDSPEGDCEHCDYCVNGYCTLQEGPDEPTGEVDEIDDHEIPDDYRPPEYPKYFEQVFYKGDKCVGVLGWMVSFITQYLEVSEKPVRDPKRDAYFWAVDVNPYVYEDEGLAVLMEDVLDVLDLRGIRCVWDRVEKVEVMYNEKN